jgi:hypothetical protein
MMPPLIDEEFGVLSAVHYRSQLVKHLGFSDQQARFGSAHQDPERRHAWLTYTWCDVMPVAKA